MKSNKFLNIVENYDTIAVFRHQNPDGDALGSQFGMVRWLQNRFPNKKVYALGENNHSFTLFPQSDDVELKGEFLAIILDTANQARIDDDRYELADQIIKIDHHPIVEDYGSLRIVDSTRGSCAEIIADLFINLDEYSFTEEIASYLLAGILTDTIRFSIETTSSKTLRTAANLVDYGANISKLNQELFTRPKAFFELRTRLSQEVVWKDKLAYIILSQDLLQELNLKEDEAKMFISIMADIIEVEIWALFIEQQDQSYRGSIRSRDITINTIARKYNGGGHRLASGVRDLTTLTLEEIIKELAKTSLS
ncbi:bifunctional oligoribonuclease/PAP phosphatase NrnA [Erysipelothrix urinaevulpis]|uniref:DHH family phosphoesterase n=1 Tax=Erysipelothrix urinaevulpis TaxID=2683717 RepID=UPI001358F334|nr:bifunctional oligoribonuclease/PAP phosphatase NrnA [Erysipelothrix urinaevulpis]